MDTSTFEQYRKLIYSESGIVLTPSKQSLLENRIQKRLRNLNIRNEVEYLKVIELDASGEELIRLIDLISTNVTFFYREADHFKFLEQQCRKWKASRQQNIRIWCAAASSGEEPYTIAMTLAENLDKKVNNPRLLATDICTGVLKQALDGIYGENELQKVPPNLKEKYFEQLADYGSASWKVKPELQQMVLFKRLNLVRFPYNLKGELDIIFCRNVMIYFDVPTKQKIVDQFWRLLKPGGYLILSNTESLLGLDSKFVKEEASVFVKPNSN